MQQLLSRPALHGFGAIRPRGLRAAEPTSTLIEQSAGSSLLAAAPFTGPAAPFVALAGSIAELLASLKVGAGCGQPCLLTTQYANQAEALLQQNIATYFCPPSGDCSNFVMDTPRSQTAQAAALQNAQAIFNELQSECSNPAYGSVGQNCISERLVSTACQWKQPASSVPPWGTPAAGACWNWINGYYSPIANDQYAVPDSQMPGASTSSSSTSTSSLSSASISADVSSITSSPYFVPGLIAAGILLFAVSGGLD